MKLKKLLVTLLIAMSTFVMVACDMEGADFLTATPDESEKAEAEESESESLSYSTNNYETAKKGNTGVFSYKNNGPQYDIYWIIDFDEGYTYYFTEGNGEETCDKLKIESGDLNDRITVTWHVGEDEWTEYIHFKYTNTPTTLIHVDNDGFETKFSTTDLEKALKIRDAKEIKER